MLKNQAAAAPAAQQTGLKNVRTLATCALLAAISHDEAIVIHHADDERRNGHAAVIDGHLAFAICTHSHTFLLAPVGRIARQHTTRVEHAVNFS